MRNSLWAMAAGSSLSIRLVQQGINFPKANVKYLHIYLIMLYYHLEVRSCMLAFGKEKTMNDFQLLIIVFTVMGLLINLVTDKKK